MNTLILVGMVGPWQIVIIVVIILLLFGGRKIPELMKGLGQGMKEFKKATKEGMDDSAKENKKIEEKNDNIE
ncbi:twin-arginine translocase TatA/TatE family subunit [Bacteroidota bacterium]